MYGDCTYGEGVYGEVCVLTPPRPRPPQPTPEVVPPPHSGCICGDGWRFETCDLSTGRLKGVLHPISADWEEKHSAPGQGSLLLASRSVTADEIWPHDTSVYISQVIGGVRVGRWAGIIEAYDADSNGTATVGIQGIDEYLFHRVLADTTGGIAFSRKNVSQTQIAVDMVNLALTPEGIPLVPVAAKSSINREKNENSWEYKNIGEAIQQFVGILVGPKYQLQHVYLNGFWSTKMVFADEIGNDNGLVLRGDIEGATYGVNVDAKDHATWVYGLGEGSEADQLTSIAYDAANRYPRFHTVQTWSDVSVQGTLNEHTLGHVIDYRDPLSTPSMTIPGLTPAPEELLLGDRVKVEFDYGLAKFDGYAFVISIGWSLRDGSPVTRSLTFLPQERASISLRKRYATAPPTAPVTAPGGAISALQDPRINDSSGMTHSKTS